MDITPQIPIEVRSKGAEPSKWHCVIGDKSVSELARATISLTTAQNCGLIELSGLQALSSLHGPIYRELAVAIIKHAYLNGAAHRYNRAQEVPFFMFSSGFRGQCPNYGEMFADYLTQQEIAKNSCETRVKRNWTGNNVKLWIVELNTTALFQWQHPIEARLKWNK